MADRYYEKRHDARGRAIWYRLKLSPDRDSWVPTKIARPSRFRKGDKILDLTEDEPTKLVHRGGKRGFRPVALSNKALRYWVENRIHPNDRVVPAVERARRTQLRLIRSGENPDTIRVFHLREDGSTRRFTISSWARFMAREKYREARERIEEYEERFVLGIENHEGALGRTVENL